MSNENLNTSPPEVDYSEIGKLNSRLANIDLSNKLILDFSKIKEINITKSINSTNNTYYYSTETLSNSGLLCFYVKITVASNTTWNNYWYGIHNLTYNKTVTSGIYFSGTNTLNVIVNKGQEYGLRGSYNYVPTEVTCYLTPFATISI